MGVAGWTRDGYFAFCIKRPSCHTLNVLAGTNNTSTCKYSQRSRCEVSSRAQQRRARNARNAARWWFMREINNRKNSQICFLYRELRDNSRNVLSSFFFACRLSDKPVWTGRRYYPGGCLFFFFGFQLSPPPRFFPPCLGNPRDFKPANHIPKEKVAALFPAKMRARCLTVMVYAW